MSGLTDIQSMLKALDLKLDPADYVFCSLSEQEKHKQSSLSPIATFVEDEGLTLVLPKAQAIESQLVYEGCFKRISLGVHSSLNAVGLTAAISTRLTEHGISANIIAAYYHDHVFVPSHLASEAMQALKF